MNRTDTEPTGVERIEALLRLAAECQPDRPAPMGLAERALLQRPPRSAWRLAPAFGTLALAGLLTVVLWPRPAAIGPAPASAPTVSNPAPPPVVANAGTGQPSIERPSGGDIAPARLAAGGAAAGSGVEPTIRPRKRRAAPRAQLAVLVRPPKVRWSVEPVQHARTGTLMPAWATHVDAETGTVVATPVVLDATMGGDDNAGGGAGTIRIIPASYSEVNR